MTQYDEIASGYDRLNEERPDRRCILVPSARHYIGEAAGIRALDLACGSGFFTRLIKEWGAAAVVGVDSSEEMIKLALTRERLRPLGVEYRVGDASRLGAIGEFDLVFAGFLLHYARSPGELRGMCAAIGANLKPGGRLVAFNENPFHPLHEGIQYDVESRAAGPIGDGTEIERIHYAHGRRGLSFTHRHYEPATYEAALAAGGLSDLAWRPFIKGEDADAGFPPGYWDRFLKDFSIIVLSARRS